MADRQHVHETVPCRTDGCDGMMICRTSRLVSVGSVIGRERRRRCEVCGRRIKTIEVEISCIGVGRLPNVVRKQEERTLF